MKQWLLIGGLMCCAFTMVSTTPTTAQASEIRTQINNHRKALDALQQRAWRMQTAFQRLLAKQHKHQLAMGRIRMQQQKLHMQQLKLQDANIKMMLQMRRLQMRQLKLQMRMSERRIALREAHAKLRQQARANAAKKAAAKTTTPKAAKKAAKPKAPKTAQKAAPRPKAKAAKQWRGYLVGPNTPVGPKMVMQHPLFRSNQSYANLITAKGKYQEQAIILFPPGPKPNDNQKLFIFTGKARRIIMGHRRGRTKGSGYSGVVITVTSWKYAK